MLIRQIQAKKVKTKKINSKYLFSVINCWIKFWKLKEYVKKPFQKHASCWIKTFCKALTSSLQFGHLPPSLGKIAFSAYIQHPIMQPQGKSIQSILWQLKFFGQTIHFFDGMRLLQRENFKSTEKYNLFVWP